MIPEALISIGLPTDSVSDVFEALFCWHPFTIGLYELLFS